MADSVGIGFPRKGMQLGHLFYDYDDNTLYMFLGGDPTDANQWRAISQPSGGAGNLDYIFSTKFIGAEISTALGNFGESFYIIPADGTLTSWSVILGNTAVTADVDVELVNDPFGADDVIDTVTLLNGLNQQVFTRNLDVAITAGTMIMVRIPTAMDPAEQEVKISVQVTLRPA